MIAEKMLARLNPTSIRFDIGHGGGAPELTAQDIAAALGMMDDGFAREVLCFVGWPDGARLSTKQLGDQLAMRQFGEFRERMDCVTTAQIALEMAKIANDGRRIARCKGMLSAALAAMWPPLVQERYAAVRRAAMLELVDPNTCRDCKGEAKVAVGEDTIECETCEGRGSVPISDRQRARRVGVNHMAYKRTWRAVYEWTFDQISDALNVGRRQFADCLGKR